ncbi:MAG TPA: nucleotide exchange factor GrpE [Longimicrobiales bacterium]|nr:nucleotide exchange factor GrpE [Longimicrobiales bacterium]
MNEGFESTRAEPDSSSGDPDKVGADGEQESMGDGGPEARAHEDLPAASEGFGHGDDFETVTVPRDEYDELNDRHLRLVAEFTNFRRRAESEALGTWSRAQADLVERFLDVLDDLTRVAALDPDDEKVTVQSIVEGIDLVEQKFMKTLADAGTEVIEPSPGDPFDPEMMEAMMRVPTDDDGKDDAVAQLFQKGYRMGRTLVRPARVSVFKAD